MTTESIPKSTTENQEKPKVVEPENLANKPEKTSKDKVEDFTKMSSEEKAEKIDEVLGNSAELASAYQNIEFEAAGGKDKLGEQVKLGWGERFKVWRAGGRESETGKQIEFIKIAEIAHREVDKKLGVIEQTDGQKLKNDKAALAVHEKHSDADLKNLEDLGVHSKDEIADIKNKLTGERETLNQDIEAKKTDVDSKLAGFREPAETKQKELAECAAEYKGYHDNVVKEITTVRGNLAKYERGLTSLKLEGDTAEEYKNKIRQAIDEQKEELTKLEVGEAALKQRLEAVKANKSEVDAYLERIDNIGKTPEEIRAKKAEKQRKEREDREASGQAKGTTPASASRPASKRDTDGEKLESEEEQVWAEHEQDKQKNKRLDDLAAQTTGGRFKPSEQVRTKTPETAAPTPEADKLKQLEVGNEVGVEKEKTIHSSILLDKIGLSNFQGDDLKAVKNYFRLKDSAGNSKDYDETAPMTEAQAFLSYKTFLTDEQGLTEDQAKLIVEDAIKKIYHPEN